MIHFDAIVDLINKNNTLYHPLTVNKLTPSLPQVAVNSTKNTVLTISAVFGSGYTGSVDVYYNRIDLSQLGSAVEVSSEEAFTVDSFLQAMIDKYGLSIVSEDLLPYDVSAIQTLEETTVTLTAHPCSLMWKGTIGVSTAVGLPSPTTLELLDTFVQQTLANLTKPQ